MCFMDNPETGAVLKTWLSSLRVDTHNLGGGGVVEMRIRVSQNGSPASKPPSADVASTYQLTFNLAAVSD